MASTTQDHIPIKDIRNDLVYLKNGDISLILQTSAVNFGLLSENEQMAIIGSFAGMLNSLSFSIQIIIRSKRMNIASYLALLDKAGNKQQNPLLSKMISRYRNFIERTIRENEVLDKKFYVVIAISGLEIGLIRDPKERLKKSLTLLKPRRDHIMRQLASIGLQAKQLRTVELISLFFDIYNDPSQAEEIEEQEVLPPEATATILKPANTPPTVPAPVTAPHLPTPQVSADQLFHVSTPKQTSPPNPAPPLPTLPPIINTSVIEPLGQNPMAPQSPVPGMPQPATPPSQPLPNQIYFNQPRPQPTANPFVVEELSE